MTDTITRKFFEIVAAGRANTKDEWREYLQALHAELPHANELFTLLRRFTGETSYAVLARAAARAGANQVLDIGCGDGNLIEDLLDLLPKDAQITAIDTCAAEIEIAKNRFAHEPRVRLDVGDARALPYEPFSFDCVLAHQFLNLVPDVGEVLEQIKRVLQPGGRLILIANRGWRADQTATWMLLHHAAMEVVTAQYPNFLWPTMGDRRIYNEEGIEQIFQESGGWDLRSLSMETFSTSAMLAPDRIAAFYNRLYLFGTAPEKHRILAAVEARACELATGERLEIDLPFRLVRIRKL